MNMKKMKETNRNDKEVEKGKERLFFKVIISLEKRKTKKEVAPIRLYL